MTALNVVIATGCKPNQINCRVIQTSPLNVFSIISYDFGV
nr:MAG TPA: hypothetical protein [Caudoviricetes sp.]